MTRTTRTSAPTRLPSRIAAIQAALLGLGLAACGGTASTAAPKPPVSPTSIAAPAAAAPAAATSAAATSAPAAAKDGSACGLVTLGEVAAATGQAMKKTGEGLGICSFSATADPSQLVYVQLFKDEHSMALQKQIEAGSAHLPGLGDDAFWATAGIVFVQKGTRGLSITMPSLTVTGLTAPPAIVTLATDAAARL